MHPVRDLDLQLRFVGGVASELTRAQVMQHERLVLATVRAVIGSSFASPDVIWSAAWSMKPVISMVCETCTLVLSLCLTAKFAVASAGTLVPAFSIKTADRNSSIVFAPGGIGALIRTGVGKTKKETVYEVPRK